MNALTPPGDFSLDHETLVTYLEENGDLAAEITTAAEAGDAEALPTLFADSGVVLCDAINAFTPRVEDLVGFFFQNECQ